MAVTTSTSGTHSCTKGHGELDAEQIYTYPNGKMACRHCEREIAAAYRAKKAGKAATSRTTTSAPVAATVPVVTRTSSPSPAVEPKASKGKHTVAAYLHHTEDRELAPAELTAQRKADQGAIRARCSCGEYVTDAGSYPFVNFLVKEHRGGRDVATPSTTTTRERKPSKRDPFRAGERITWKQGDTERSGEVWEQGPTSVAATVWVIPDEPYAWEAAAVLVHVHRTGKRAGTADSDSSKHTATGRLSSREYQHALAQAYREVTSDRSLRTGYDSIHSRAEVRAQDIMLAAERAREAA